MTATFVDEGVLHVEQSLSETAMQIGSRLAYLATPYTRLVVDVRGQFDRYKSLDVELRTARWSRAFALQGVTVASPILTACSICHADTENAIDPLDDPFWARWCQPMLEACGAIVVPPMEGWAASRGVWREVSWALQHDVPVYLVAKENPAAGAEVPT
ncbi:hypothetical protein FHS89_001806 [Rubricella aquisinus]|uniref:DUF1937 domain-containing protein n=1 Tax=Rubricella aquisinus TaxID=2028108 RepID=A0A840X1P8_9RHOB|nr:DUF1937 family protein [Rubricella aquisinus]MBB5515786.1 hypothetical protein [Rubricella aquisinus]